MPTTKPPRPGAKPETDEPTPSPTVYDERQLDFLPRVEVDAATTPAPAAMSCAPPDLDLTPPDELPTRKACGRCFREVVKDQCSGCNRAPLACSCAPTMVPRGGMPSVPVGVPLSEEKIAELMHGPATVGDAGPPCLVCGGPTVWAEPRRPGPAIRRCSGCTLVPSLCRCKPKTATEEAPAPIVADKQRSGADRRTHGKKEPRVQPVGIPSSALLARIAEAGPQLAWWGFELYGPDSDGALRAVRDVNGTLVTATETDFDRLLVKCGEIAAALSAAGLSLVPPAAVPADAPARGLPDAAGVQLAAEQLRPQVEGLGAELVGWDPSKGGRWLVKLKLTSAAGLDVHGEAPTAAILLEGLQELHDAHARFLAASGQPPDDVEHVRHAVRSHGWELLGWAGGAWSAVLDLEGLPLMTSGATLGELVQRIDVLTAKMEAAAAAGGVP